MSEQETRIEELERPAEELTEKAAEEVRGGGWTLASTPGGASNPTGPTDSNTKQTRQSSVVVDL